MPHELNTKCADETFPYVETRNAWQFSNSGIASAGLVGARSRLGGGASSSRVNTSLLSRRSARSRCRTVILSQMEGQHTTPTPACPSCGNPGPSWDEDHVSLGAISIGARPCGVRDANGQALAAVDHTAIVRPLDAPDIRRQARFNPIPLLFAHQNRFLRISRSSSNFEIRIVFSGRKN